MSTKLKIAYFISPHGFGHAARAAAVMSELHRIEPRVQFEIYTRVPRWFFEQSLSVFFNYHPLLTDVGIIQKTPLCEDVEKTLESLDGFFPIADSPVSELADGLKKLGCGLVICDISPMGILAAKAAGIPSVLVENFTWDWIYEGYAAENPGLLKHIDYLKSVFGLCDYHIQCEPVCDYRKADLVVNPVSRRQRTPPSLVRGKLGIRKEAKMVTITMGGIPEKRHDFLENLTRCTDLFFVIPGGGWAREVYNNVILLPHKSEFYYPDLINASDLVIGKLGYSTLAEVYHAGIPFGYIERPGFRESKVLAEYAESNMSGFSMTEEEFQDGGWLPLLNGFPDLPPARKEEINGAGQAASFIFKILNHDSISKF